MQLITKAKNSVVDIYRTVKMIWADFFALLRLLEVCTPIALMPKYNLIY
ncbi:MAG: hypothetical protein ACJATI_003449 [Halioglobus sp.]|jgi:hypothetical protein